MKTYKVISAVGVAGEFKTRKQAADLVRRIKASGAVPAKFENRSIPVRRPPFNYTLEYRHGRLSALP